MSREILELAGVIDQAWSDLVEKDDRTSPEDYPDMALITADELREFMERAAALRASAVAEPVAGEWNSSYGKGNSWYYDAWRSALAKLQTPAVAEPVDMDALHAEIKKIVEAWKGANGGICSINGT